MSSRLFLTKAGVERLSLVVLTLENEVLTNGGKAIQKFSELLAIAIGGRVAIAKRESPAGGTGSVVLYHLNAIEGNAKIRFVSVAHTNEVGEKVNYARCIEVTGGADDSYVISEDSPFSIGASDIGALPSDGTAADADKLGGNIPTYYATKAGLDNIAEELEKVKMSAHANVTVIGSPTFNSGSVEGFSPSNYLVFPTTVDIGDRTVEFNLSFSTRENVTTQENILDSACGLAFAIRGGKFVFAVSTNGTSFTDEVIANYTVNTNTSYRTKLTFEKLAADAYRMQLSVADGTGEYVAVGSVTEPLPIAARPLYMGGANPQSGVHHIFSGVLNLNMCSLVVNGKTVWNGFFQALPDHAATHGPDGIDPLVTRELSQEETGKAADAASVAAALSDKMDKTEYGSWHVATKDGDTFVGTGDPSAIADPSRVIVLVRNGEISYCNAWSYNAETKEISATFNVDEYGTTVTVSDIKEVQSGGLKVNVANGLTPSAVALVFATTAFKESVKEDAPDGSLAKEIYNLKQGGGGGGDMKFVLKYNSGKDVIYFDDGVNA